MVIHVRSTKSLGKPSIVPHYFASVNRVIAITFCFLSVESFGTTHTVNPNDKTKKKCVMLTAEQIPLTDRPLNKSNEVGKNLVECVLKLWGKGRLLHAEEIATTIQCGSFFLDSA